MLHKLSAQVVRSGRLASGLRFESHARFSYNEFNVSRVFPRSFMFHGHSLRSQSPFDILCCRRQPRVLLLRVCFCLAKEIPRDRRVHRQLHIDRILQNRQKFVPLPTLRQTQICQPERKTVDSRVARRVLLCFRSRICNNTLSRTSRYLSQRRLSTDVSRRNLYFVVSSLIDIEISIVSHLNLFCDSHCHFGR